MRAIKAVEKPLSHEQAKAICYIAWQVIVPTINGRRSYKDADVVLHPPRKSRLSEDGPVTQR